jgi:hypothetical protein
LIISKKFAKDRVTAQIVDSPKVSDIASKEPAKEEKAGVGLV